MEPDIRDLIIDAESGDAGVQQALFAALYAELTRLARRELARVGPSVTISASTLVHEVYVDLSSRHGTSFPDKGRFLAYAARAMRGIIIDYARRRCALKRGGGFEITAIRTEPGVAVAEDTELLRIGEALDQLATVDPMLAQIVDLKFFCGLSLDEIAELQNSSTRTVQRRWEKARIYLHSCLQADVVG